MESRPSSSAPGTEARDTACSGVNFQLLFEASPGLYLVLNPGLQIVAVSDAYLRATMTKRAEILGRSIFDVFPDNPEDQGATGVSNLSESLARVLQNRVQDTMAVQKYDIRRPESEGGGFEERYWSPVNHPVSGPTGEVAYLIHRVEDVTEFIHLRRRSTEQDRLAEQLRSRTAQMEAEIFMRAQDIQDANRQLREAKGKLEERVRERTEELARANESLKAEIEQSRRLEEQFRRAQKLEAFGQLAGGVAHDFNNLTMAINGFTEMMLSGVIPAAEHPQYLREVRKAGGRAATLTRQLLAFSRKQVLQPVTLDLNELVRELEKMLRRLIGADIDLRTVCDPALGRIRSDAGQIEQVILNLVVIARDAIPSGGYISIETRNVELDEEYARHHPEVRPGSFVLLAVSDTGTGMDAAVKARIFEPFFTTKEVGQGTGLGLAVVHGIIKQSGGTIEVYSEPGHGTSFKIYLPRVAEPARARKSFPGPAPMPTGTETILLVDDDEMVRDTARLALESAGYTVIAVCDGDDALQQCQAHPGRIELLLSDVVMPRMNGRQLADLIRGLRQDIKVIFMSGYTDDAILRHGIQAGATFLQKPLTPLALCRKVREVLG